MNIHISGPVNSSTGYGLMTCNIIKALNNLCQNITLFPINNRISTENEEDQKFFQSLLPQTKGFNKDAVSLRIYHQFDLFHHTTNKRAAFTVFELDNFKPEEFLSLQSNQVLMTCSQWGCKVIEDKVGLSCSSVPLGVDRTIFNENVVPTPPNIHRRHRDTFVVYMAGKLEKRKSVIEAVQAFNRAFTNKDDVELWLSISNPFMSPEEFQNEVNSTILNPRLNPLCTKTRIIPRKQTQRDLAEVMSQTNAGLFLSRAEGWNLEALEMMACGKDVVLTNYSGHTEYANSSNSHLIEVEYLEEARDGKWFHGGGNWARVGPKEIELAAAKLKGLYNKTIESKSAAAIITAKWQNWESCANGIINTLEGKFV